MYVDFWKRVSVVGNLVRKILNCHMVNIADIKCNHSTYLIQIKEYQLLKGYRPLHIINEEYLSNEDGFLEASDAVDVLELSTAPSASQDTSTLSTISEDGALESRGMQENKARLLRLIEICEHLATTEAPLMSKNGDYFYKERSSCFTSKTVLACRDKADEDSSVGAANFSPDTDDEADDAIVDDGKKDRADDDALLHSDPFDTAIPIASFANTEHNVEVPLHKATTEDVNMADGEEESSRLATTTIIKPPPGFGVSAIKAPSSGQTTSFLSHDAVLTDKNLTPALTESTIDVSGFPTPPKNRNILDQVIQGRNTPTDSSTASFQLPHQQNRSIITDHGLSSKITHPEMFYSFQGTHLNLATSVEESIRIFGDMKTANPFVVDPPPSSFSLPTNDQTIIKQPNLFGTRNAAIFPNYTAVSEGHLTTDETKWLNSNLLNSLWMAESGKTENP